MNITSKKMMYRLLRDGYLGNTFRIWRSTEEFMLSGFKGLCGVRCSDQPGAPYWHHLTPHQTLYAVALFEDMGHTPVIYEAAPDHHIVMQGEYQWDDIGRFWLRYSRAKTHMRNALVVDNNYLDGRAAEILLRHAAGQESWHDIVWLSQTYPGHAWEFTAFDKKVGFEQKKVIIWEARTY